MDKILAKSCTIPFQVPRQQRLPHKQAWDNGPIFFWTEGGSGKATWESVDALRELKLEWDLELLEHYGDQ